jgi:hypothetical protein
LNGRVDNTRKDGHAGQGVECEPLCALYGWIGDGPALAFAERQANRLGARNLVGRDVWTAHRIGENLVTRADLTHIRVVISRGDGRLIKGRHWSVGLMVESALAGCLSRDSSGESYRSRNNDGRAGVVHC